MMNINKIKGLSCNVDKQSYIKIRWIIESLPDGKILVRVVFRLYWACLVIVL